MQKAVLVEQVLYLGRDLALDLAAAACYRRWVVNGCSAPLNAFAVDQVAEVCPGSERKVVVYGSHLLFLACYQGGVGPLDVLASWDLGVLQEVF